MGLFNVLRLNVRAAFAFVDDNPGRLPVAADFMKDVAAFPFVHNPVVRELALQSRGEPVFKFKAVGLGRRALLQLLDTLLQGGDVLILASQYGSTQ